MHRLAREGYCTIQFIHDLSIIRPSLPPYGDKPVPFIGCMGAAVFGVTHRAHRF